MLRRFRRPEHDEFFAFLFDDRREFFALVGCHVSRAAMRAFIVAHTRPLVGPTTSATRALVEIEKPGHAILLGSQTIISTRHEIDKSAIAQVLQLLAYLWLDVLVARIEVAKMPLKSVDFLQREIAFSE